ncbi:hypothetical protein GY45DRAFT_1315974 [Cubamyces sp. BRFM 1775]|nr:hypothetical protein GY45DRAFT_1315974 [Cubamyces sp. BRFM 1775]
MSPGFGAVAQPAPMYYYEHEDRKADQHGVTLPMKRAGNSHQFDTLHIGTQLQVLVYRQALLDWNGRDSLMNLNGW